MVRSALLPPLAALAACAQPADPAAAGTGGGGGAAPAPSGAPFRLADCPLAISFGSYATGIDGGAYRAVEALLAADPAVTGIERAGPGREGEMALCVRVRRGAHAERLARAIAARLPAAPRGPIAVTTRSGLRFDAPPRPR